MSSDALQSALTNIQQSDYLSGMPIQYHLATAALITAVGYDYSEP